MHTCMHPSFLPLSCSLASMQTHTAAVACSVMDAGHKDGQDEKVSHIRVCGLLIYVCCTSGVHVRICVWVHVCVCRVTDWEQTCFALPRNSKTLLLSLLLHGAGSVWFSSDCYGENDYFILCPSQRCRLLFDELSWAFVASLHHHLFFPFVPQWGVSRETGNTGLKPLNCQNIWECWESVWAMLGPANRRDCSSVLFCFGCGNGRMVGS